MTESEARDLQKKLRDLCAEHNLWFSELEAHQF